MKSTWNSAWHRRGAVSCLLLLSSRENMRKETQRQGGRQPRIGVLKLNADSSQLLIFRPGTGAGWEVAVWGLEEIPVGKSGCGQVQPGQAPGMDKKLCTERSLTGRGSHAWHLLRTGTGSGGWEVGGIWPHCCDQAGSGEQGPLLVTPMPF